MSCRRGIRTELPGLRQLVVQRCRPARSGSWKLQTVQGRTQSDVQSLAWETSSRTIFAQLGSFHCTLPDQLQLPSARCRQFLACKFFLKIGRPCVSIVSPSFPNSLLRSSSAIGMILYGRVPTHHRGSALLFALGRGSLVASNTLFSRRCLSTVALQPLNGSCG